MQRLLERLGLMLYVIIYGLKKFLLQFMGLMIESK